MSSAQNTLELQQQVRHNAQEYRNQLNDLFNWEKEIKDKEKQVQRGCVVDANVANDPKLPPVRSHVATAQKIVVEKSVKSNVQEAVESSGTQNVNQAAEEASTPPTEKVDLPFDANHQRHKEANDIKDRGNNFVKLTQYEQAIDSYNEAITLYPEDAIYYCNRALCYLKLERYEECIEDCERAIGIDKLCVKAYYRRMQANEFIGNNMDALKDCTTVLALEPKNIEGKKSLQRINERIRQHANACRGPNFSAERNDLIDILPIEKPAYKRSKNLLRRVPIVDVVGPKANIEETNTLRISDEDIDKLFNSNCGPYEEVKKPSHTLLAEQQASKRDCIKHENNIKETPKDKLKAQESDKIKEIKYNEKSNVASNSEINRPLPPPPMSTAQFYTNWKELSPALKYQYLKSIEIERLCKVLGAGFDSDTLAALLCTLRDYYVPKSDPTTIGTLLEISRNPQVTILAMLMSSNEKEALKGIVESVRNWPHTDPNVLSKIIKNFDLE